MDGERTRRRESDASKDAIRRKSGDIGAPLRVLNESPDDKTPEQCGGGGHPAGESGIARGGSKLTRLPAASVERCKALRHGHQGFRTL